MEFRSKSHMRGESEKVKKSQGESRRIKVT